MGDFFEMKKEKKLHEDSTASDDELIPRTKQSRHYCGIWLIASTLTTCLLFTLLTWRTDFFVHTVASQLVLRNGTRLYEAWAEDPVTTTFSVYLFNYTNIEQFEKGLEKKLQLQEIGPYSYTVTTTKENVVFHDNNTVSYQERKIYKFAPQLSNGVPTDNVTTPSVPYLGSQHQFRESGFVTRWMVDKALSMAQLKQSTPFITVTVDELLWGYDDRLFTLAAQVMKFNKQALPFDKFGLFVGKNGTQPDVNTIYTGAGDIYKKGLLSRFNGEVALNHWGTPLCNSLEAYPGSALPPYLTAKTIHVYTKEACRRIPMVLKASELVKGVPTSRYELPEDFYSNTKDNECFCGKTCLPDGVLNASACAFGAPVMTSKPHFLHGSPVLSEMFAGIAPDVKKHGMYANIEPNLGLIMDARSTAQMNVMVNNQYGMSLNGVYRDGLILPVTWVSVTVDDMSTPLLWEVRAIVTGFAVSQTVVYYGPLLISILCIMVLIFKQCRKRQHKRRNSRRFSSKADSSVITDSCA